MQTGAAPNGQAERKKTRVKDGPIELFGGKLVNTARLGPVIHRPSSAIAKLIQMGMPHIKIGARYWFDPEAVLAWFKQHEVQKNQTRAKTRRG